MGKVLKLVTPDGGFRKKNAKKFLRVITQFLNVFRLNFGLKGLF